MLRMCGFTVFGETDSSAAKYPAVPVPGRRVNHLDQATISNPPSHKTAKAIWSPNDDRIHKGVSASSGDSSGELASAQPLPPADSASQGERSW